MTTQPSPGQQVPAITRAAAVLAALAEATEGLSLADLARTIDAPKSSLLNICTTLTSVGFISRTDSLRYTLGPALMGLGQRYLQNGLPEVFYRTCRNLGLDNSDTLVLAVREWTEVVYVAQRQGQRALAVQYHLGMRLPASTTASGKASLSTLSDDEVASMYRSSPKQPLSEERLDRLIDELASIRKNGYAIDDEETAAGMLCVGVPLFTKSHRSFSPASVAVSLVKATVTEEVLATQVVTMKTVAERMSKAASEQSVP